MTDDEAKARAVAKHAMVAADPFAPLSDTEEAEVRRIYMEYQLAKARKQTDNT